MIVLVSPDPASERPLAHALDRMGVAWRLAVAPDDVGTARLILLASGAPFAVAASRLRHSGWWRELPQLVSEGIALVGVDGAMHLLAEGSEDAPRESGLCLIPGYARRLGPGARVPHLGWSRVWGTQASDLSDPGGAWFYFAHGHALDPSEATLWRCQHGRDFSAVARRGRVLGIQLRPELSGPLGTRLLHDILSWSGVLP